MDVYKAGKIERWDVEIWEDKKVFCATCGAHASSFLRRSDLVASFCAECILDVAKVATIFIQPDPPHPKQLAPKSIGREEYDTVLNKTKKIPCIPDEVSGMLKDQFGSVLSGVHSLMKDAVLDCTTAFRARAVENPDGPSSLEVSVPILFSRTLAGSKKKVTVSAVSPRPGGSWTLRFQDAFKGFFSKLPNDTRVRHDGMVYSWNSHIGSEMEAVVTSGGKSLEEEFLSALNNDRPRFEAVRKAADRKKLTKLLKKYDYMSDEVVDIAHEIVVDQVHNL